MNMLYCQIRPGKVLKVVNEYGYVKASCVGLFSMEDDPDLLPPVRPFMKASPSQFCKPNIGDALWIMCFGDNPQELYYFFQGDVQNTIGESMKTSSGDLDKYDKSYNMLMKCNSGTSDAQVSFSNEEGMLLKNDMAQMTVNKDDMSLTTSSSSIDLDNTGVHLSGTEHTVARGDIVSDYLSKIRDTLNNLANNLKSNQFTAAAGTALSAEIAAKLSSFNDVESPEVTVK